VENFDEVYAREEELSKCRDVDLERNSCSLSEVEGKSGRVLEDLRFLHIFSTGVVFWLFLSFPDLLQTCRVFDLFSVIVILVVHFVLLLFCSFLK
jgi:hypothetical protein